MTATPQQMQEHLETLTRLNDAMSENLKQTKESLDDARNMIQQNITNIAKLQNDVSLLVTENAALNTKLTNLTVAPAEANRSRDLINRITKTDLLKSKEIPSFGAKDNFEVWSEYFKNDLYAKLPEIKQFIDYAEDQSNKSITLTKDIH